MRYSLKSLAIGFECPILDMSNKEWVSELLLMLNDAYPIYIDILKNELDLLGLPSGNHLLLYNLVAKVDTKSVTRRQLDSDWMKLELDITNAIHVYLSKLKVEFYRKLD